MAVRINIGIEISGFLNLCNKHFDDPKVKFAVPIYGDNFHYKVFDNYNDLLLFLFENNYAKFYIVKGCLSLKYIKNGDLLKDCTDYLIEVIGGRCDFENIELLRLRIFSKNSKIQSFFNSIYSKIRKTASGRGLYLDSTLYEKYFYFNSFFSYKAWYNLDYKETRISETGKKA